MLILVINCGSSSAKYQLIDVQNRRSLAKGMVERIGQPNPELCHEQNGGRKVKERAACRDHYGAIKIIVDALIHPVHGVIGSRNEIGGIGHRVVHGGEEFKGSVILTKKVIRSLEKFNALAPLHNPPSLSGIRACSAILKGVPQVAVFDTSFHQTMPEEAFLYGLPYKYYAKYGIRRYGFHGTSHRYVSAEAAKVLKRPLKKLRMVTCHLGNGCSMAAVSGGKSIDTSMGFTPLEGLLMGTRSGDIDPAAVLYIIDKEKLSSAGANDLLNKSSGLLGLSGVSNDMRDILKAIKSGGRDVSRRCRSAIDVFVYRIKKYIGAYQAAMGGLDAVVFTAGVGEHNPWIVKRIASEMKGVVTDAVRFIVIPTNEELLIAKDSYELIRRKSREEE